MAWRPIFRMVGYVDMVIHAAFMLITLAIIPSWYLFMAEDESKENLSGHITLYWIIMGASNLFNVLSIVAAWRLVKATRQEFDPSKAMQRFMFWRNLNWCLVFGYLLSLNIVGIILSITLICVASSQFYNFQEELDKMEDDDEQYNISNAEYNRKTQALI